MNAFSLSRSSIAAVTSRIGSPADSSRAMPSGAASTQITVMSVQPRSASRRQQCSSEPPVASIGSSTSTGSPLRSVGSDSR
jgi:hypothetical protein